MAKSKQMLAIIIGLFVALSYGLSKCEWAFGTCYIILVVGLAGISALTLLAATLAACLCLQISDTPVVGIEEIRKRLDSGEMLSLRPMQIYTGLSGNVADAIKDTRENLEKRRHRGKVLNTLTFAGVITTSLFITCAIWGDVATSHAQSSQKGEQSNVRIYQPEP
ncbi:MAG: hypothetical protein ACFHWZ_15415 [Phycisphaerales bacterium]